MNRKFLKYILTLFVVVAFWACNGFNKVLKSSDYELKYTKAIEYYNKTNYTSAKPFLKSLYPFLKVPTVPNRFTTTTPIATTT